MNRHLFFWYVGNIMVIIYPFSHQYVLFLLSVSAAYIQMHFQTTFDHVEANTMNTDQTAPSGAV